MTFPHVTMALVRGYKGVKNPLTTKEKHSISGISKTLKSYEIPLKIFENIKRICMNKE